MNNDDNQEKVDEIHHVDISQIVKGGWLLKMPEDIAADWKRQAKGTTVATINKKTNPYSITLRNPLKNGKNTIHSRLKIKNNVKNTKIFRREMDGKVNPNYLKMNAHLLYN